MRILKQLVKRTPLYGPLNALRRDFTRRRIIRQWRRQRGSTPPPPELKHATIKQYAKRFHSDVLIETGTYFGDTIEAVKNNFTDVYSIELSPELHKRAKDRFGSDPRVHLLLGDSGELLKKILPTIARTPLFWLDAHYSEGITAKGTIDTPIVQELDAIFAFCARGVVLIDDARMFNGTNAYPTLAEITDYVARKAPNWVVEVREGIIRLHER
jgi:hypothetical protein